MTSHFQRGTRERLALRGETRRAVRTPLNRSTDQKGLSLQRCFGNSHLQETGETQWKKQPGATATAGGLSGLKLDVTFSVSGQPATSLQVIQVVWTTRGSKQLGAMTWSENSKTYDAFVDGGNNSPFVTEGGNPPAHPTNPYYLTASEVANEVKFSKDSGSVHIYDLPTAVAEHDEAYFETAVVAINHNNSGKDKILQAFDWGWTGKGTVPTVSKGTEVAGKELWG